MSNWKELGRDLGWQEEIVPAMIELMKAYGVPEENAEAFCEDCLSDMESVVREFGQ